MTSPSKPKAWAGSVVTSARAYWATRLPRPCALCGKPVTSSMDWVVEHLVPRHLGGNQTRRSNQGVSHRKCSDKSGSQVRSKGRAKPSTYAPPMAPASERGLRGI